MAVDRKRIYHKRDRLRQLRAFCRTARLSSITQAAESLGVSQSSVSIQVRELEGELETVLFDRNGPRVGLTPAGKRLFELAEPLVRGMDELSATLLEESDSDAPGRRVQLAASTVAAGCVLPPYVARFRDSSPGVCVEVRNCVLRDGLNLLFDNKVEFVLGVQEPQPDRTLEFHHILSYDVVLITAEDHPLANRTTVSPEEISAWPAIVPASGTYSRQLGEIAARQHGVRINVVIEVGGWRLIKRYVECGLGISVVPSVALVATDRVAVIPLAEYFPTRSFGVYTRRGKYLTPPALRLLRLMIPDFPDPLLPPPPTDGRIAGPA